MKNYNYKSCNRISNTYRRMTNKANNVIKPKFSNIPTMVLWDKYFNHRDPFYRLSFAMDETPQRMAKLFLEIDIPDNTVEEPFVEFEAPTGQIFCVADWDTFHKKANRFQVLEVDTVIAPLLESKC